MRGSSIWLCACVACVPVPPSSIADVALVPGATFDTFTLVPLHVSVDRDSDATRVAVALPDGQPLLDETIAVALSRDPVLTVPATTTSLAVTVSAPGQADRHLRVPVVGGEAWLEVP